MKPERFIRIIQTIILLNCEANKQPKKNFEEVLSAPNQQNIPDKVEINIYINGKKDN